MQHLIRLARDERGQDLVEYAIMAGFVFFASCAIFTDCAKDIKIFLGGITIPTIRISCGIIAAATIAALLLHRHKVD